MSIKCAIFDFDGTLFDSMYIWESVGETYLRSLGIEPEASLREDIREMSLYQSAAYMRKKYDMRISEEEITEGINRTVENFYFFEILPKRGVAEFLELLKKGGIKMCIATASDRRHVETALRRCSLDGYFDAVFTCDEVGYGKDEAVIFRKASDFFGVSHRETVVFEDALHAARTAKSDGYAVAAVYDSSEKRQSEIRALADCFIEDFEHTEDFLRFVREN